MATIKDIANATGFSITTVSRALNNYDDVNEKTKQTILEAAKKINYSPNIIAQNLVKKKSKTIGIIVNELKREGSKNNFMLEILCGAANALEIADYEFILLSTSSAKQRNKTFYQICSERQLAGVIIQGLKIGDPYLQEAQQSNIPCVLIDIPLIGKSIRHVTSNQLVSIEHAIKYLYRLGHRHIAYINGSEEAHVSGIRKQGYIEALKNLSIEPNDKYIIAGDFSEEVAKKNITPFLLNHPEVTAIFCASDIMALGVLQAAKELSIKIPEQISVIGFDNIFLSEHTTPSLTTIAQSPYKMAGEAADSLIHLIENPEDNTPPKIIENELVIRESTAFAPSLPKVSTTL